jgi:hypothetical protein
MSLFGAPKVSHPLPETDSLYATNQINSISSLQPASALVNRQQQAQHLPLHPYSEDSVRNQQRVRQHLLLVRCSVEVNSSNNRHPVDCLVNRPSVNSLSNNNNREPRVDYLVLVRVRRINSSSLNNNSRTGLVREGCSGVVVRLEDSGSTSRPLLPPLVNLKRALNSLKGSSSSLNSISSNNNNSNNNSSSSSKPHHGPAALEFSWNPSSRLTFPVTCCSRISRRNSQIPPRLS